jgi:signal transduction histidine kinase
MNLQNTKSNYTQILIPIIGILIIISWLFIISPDLKNEPSAFEVHIEQKGERSFVKNISDPLPISEPTRQTLTSQVTKSDGNIFEIKSIFRSIDILTDEITWEATDTYFVDKTTRKHVGDKEGQFQFPYSIQKQNYIIHHPLIGAATTLFFDGTEFIDDLEVYVFSCESLDTDRSSTYPQFAPEIIHSDHTCLAKMEPVTGHSVYTHVAWNNYVIRDSLRIPIDVGYGEISEYTQDILIKRVKDEKELFQFYDRVVPTFMLLTMGAVFSTSIYNKKSKEKGKFIKKQFEALKQADKTKTLFLNNLTHELKTPLVPIQGNVEMLKNPKMGELNEMQKESVDEIYNHSTALLSTVENFLKLQKITEGKSELHVEKVDLDELIEIISKIPTKENIEISISFDNGLLVNADKSELIWIITELIKNTTDFLPEQDGKIEISAKEKNGNVIISVKDNGSGIPKEKQKDIFKPFIKVDMSQSRTHGGVGLGLSICKGLIEVMNGTIWVESDEGKGSTFFFTIPKA